MIVGLSQRREHMNIFKHAQEIIMAEETAKLFFEKSINTVTIKDIAEHLGIGEATIYRHYKNKYNIVLSVAGYLQKKVVERYFNIDKNLSGYEQIEKFYNSYLDIFQDDPMYYKFINEFDAFVILNNSQDMSQYEEGIDVFKTIFFGAYNKGLQDGTIKEIEDIDSFYFATTHATLGLCKKLADKDILSQDQSLDKTKEIKVLIETILYRFK